MSMKMKGQTWVGNIYQRFEAVCQEVDDFVSKDTVKSVKTFCSGVVQDILPPLKDPVKHVTQVVPMKQIDAIGTYTRSIIGIKEEPLDTERKQSPLKEGSSGPTENHHTSNITGLCHAKQFNTPTDGYSSEEADTNLSFGQNGDSLLNNTTDIGFDKRLYETAVEEGSPCEGLSSPKHDNLSKPFLYSECVDENYYNDTQAKVSLATLTNDLERRSSEEEDMRCNTFSESDDVISVNANKGVEANEDLDMGVANNVVEEELSPSENLSSIDEKHNNKDLAKISTSTLVNGLGISYSQEERTLRYRLFDEVECVSNTSSTHQSSELEFSIVYRENNVEQMPSSFLPTESYNPSNSSRTNFLEEAEHAEFEAFISSLEIGAQDNLIVDVEDLGMETIDLSDNVKLDETCVLVEDNPLYAFSSRSGKARSYKKIIQDAFASRKRLTKEYEQLAIWCGDIDTEFSQLPKQNNLVTVGTISLELKKSPAQDLHDSEWELL